MFKKYWFLLVIFIITFLAELQPYRGTVLKIAMEGTNELKPQVFYKKSVDQGYSEKLSLRRYTHKGENYLFPFEQYKSVSFLRIDPTTRPDKINLKEISLIVNGWFSVEHYKIDTKKIVPRYHISNYKVKNNGITFESVGNDPNLEVPFKLELIKSSIKKDLIMQKFLVAVLVTILGFVLFYIYYKYEHNTSLYTKLILYSLFFAFTFFKVNYYKEHINIGYPPDESVHYTYITYVHKHHHIVPDFKDMKHYLSHPPLYYEIMNLYFDENKTKEENIYTIRDASSYIYFIAFIVILYIGFRANLSVVGDLVFLTIVTAIPMHAYIGASINNDTLGILGGALFALGFIRFLEHNHSMENYFLIAVSIIVAFFAKFTVALLILFAVIAYLIYSRISNQRIVFNKKGLIFIFIALIPIVYYQFEIMYTYHAIVPTYAKTHPQEYLKSGFYTLPQYRIHLNISEWFERLLGYIQGGWFGIHSHHSFAKESWFGSFGLLILHFFAIVALFLRCPKNKERFCLLGKFTLFSIFLVLFIQFIFSYRVHLHSGYMGGLQPRYLLPFMFAFAIMASLFVERFQKSFWVVVGVILLSIHALYSDFFYFLQYYR